MTIRRVALPLLLAAAACNNDHVSTTGGGVLLAVASLSFPDTYVGHPREAKLQLQNASLANQSAEVSRVDAPFSTTSASLDLGPGDTVPLTVRFDPTSPGDYSGSLVVALDGATLTVALSGKALAVPACPTAAPCHDVHFDADSGQCVDLTLTDDTACPTASACLVDGRCRAGSCVGTEKDCNDDNACTRDLCDPLSGCVHEDLTATCPDPGETCRVAACDPKTGCTSKSALDGTPCGNADCVTADVCLLGACRTVSVPEGSMCAPATPCQGKGVCHNQVCDRPAAGPLQPVWTYAPTSPFSISNRVAADSAGQLYWIEWGTMVSDLVSYTRDGYPRYRQRLGGENQGYGNNLMLVDDLAVVTLDNLIDKPKQARIEAYHTADGSLAWSRDLLADLASEIHDSTNFADLSISGAGPGALVFRMTRNTFSSWDTWVLLLSTSDGSTLWSKRTPAYLESPTLADEHDDLYVWTNPAGGAQVASYTIDGSTRWQLNDYVGQLAVYGSRLLAVSSGTNGLQLIDAAGGKIVADSGVRALGSSPNIAGPVISGAAAFALGTWPATPPYGTDVSLFKLDLGTGTASPIAAVGQAASLWTPYPTTAPVLTSRGTILLAHAPSAAQAGSTWVLRELLTDGRELYRCDLPALGGFWSMSEPVLRGERLTVEESGSLYTYDAPGLDVAAHGWPCAQGGMDRAFHAR